MGSWAHRLLGTWALGQLGTWPIGQLATWALGQSLTLGHLKNLYFFREIHRGQDGPYRHEIGLALFCVFSSYVISRHSNRSFNFLLKAPLKVRLAQYLIIGGNFVLFYIVAKDRFFGVKKSEQLDDLTARQSAKYAQGGIDYYSKCQQRNMALRNILPNENGKKMFNLKGDLVPGLFRNPIKPVSQRKEECTKVLELHQAGLN
jgi:hypothetical protein